MEGTSVGAEIDGAKYAKSTARSDKETVVHDDDTKT